MTWAALGALSALAWGYLVWLAGQMSMPDMPGMKDMPGMTMDSAAVMLPALAPWDLGHVLFIFAMWAVMMVGMMTPTIAPIVLLYARLTAGVTGSPTPRRLPPAGWFVGGYLAAWTIFSGLAALAQCGFERLALLTPMMASANHRFGGAVLIAAGVYQWAPVKNSCLIRCRAPLSFIQKHGGFQTSRYGAWRLGFLHGINCVGCCWALMAVLFVVGVMNLLWIAALMVIVLLEKMMPGGYHLARALGSAAVVAGTWMMAS